MVDWSKIGAGIVDFLDQSDEAAAAHQAKLNRDKVALEAARKIATDRKQEPGRRVQAARQVDLYQQYVDSNPLVLQERNRTQAAQRQNAKADRLLEKQGIVVAPPAAVANAPKLSFAAAPAAAGTAAVAAPAAPAGNSIFAGVDPAVAAFVQAAGGTPTSGKRTQADQERLRRTGYNPSPTSGHLDGLAVDFVPADPKQGAALAAQAVAMGFTDSYFDPKKGHVHVGKDRGAIDMVSPTVAAAPGAIQTGPVAVARPEVLAGMMRAPQAMRGINLPDAPQRELPPDMQPHQTIDVEAMLAPLEAAMMPEAPDTASRPWDRIQSMLVSAGAAAAGADPGAGMGQWLLRAGTGAAQGFQSEREDQRNEDKVYKEQVRSVKTALATQGFQLKLKNLDTENFNADRVTQNIMNKQGVTYENMAAKDKRKVDELLYNTGVFNQNVQQGNQFRSAQDNVVIGGVQQMAGAVNAANSQQTQANAYAARDQGVDNTQTRIDSMLTGAGIDIRGKNPRIATARSTAAAILANRPDAAISSFAEELVQTPGAVQTILAPDKNDTPEVAAAKVAALKEYKRAKKPEDAWGVVANLAQLMGSDHGATLEIANMFKGQSPSATLILEAAAAASQQAAAPAGAPGGQ